MDFSFNKQQIPPAVALLKLLATLLAQCEELLADAAFRHRIVQWRQQPYLELDPQFQTDYSAVCFVQACMLGGLSMHNGVLVPDLKGLGQKGNEVVLYWQNGISTKWQIGCCDAAYYACKRDIANKLFPNQYRHKTHTETAFFVQITQKIRMYAGLLPEVQACLDAIRSPTTLRLWLRRDVAKEQLFVLLSCLPIEQLNVLFLALGNGLPEDVPLKIQQQQTLNLTQVFRQPSQDAGFLVEKIAAYMALYYTVDWPILQQITRYITHQFVENEVLVKPAIFAQVCQTAREIGDTQVSPRRDIYRVLLHMLAGV